MSRGPMPPQWTVAIERVLAARSAWRGAKTATERRAALETYHDAQRAALRVMSDGTLISAIYDAQRAERGR